MKTKIDLWDVTFNIILRLDSIERLENIIASITFLNRHFNTNVTVWECSYRDNGFLKKLLDNARVSYVFKQDDDPILFRTHYLNQMIQETTTPIVSIWDTDVIAPVNQIIDAVNLLRLQEADFVYPYDKLFLDTSIIIRNLYLESEDISLLMNNTKKMKQMYPPKPVGGAFFCNLKAYKESGLENEKFYGWGMEDGERYCRWEKMGYRMKRIDGPLFHLSHPRGINSDMHHPDQHVIKMREFKAANRFTKKVGTDV